MINYKTTDFSKALKEVAPDGVDIYFDNVGGEFYSTIMRNHLRPDGRILICGAISMYESTGPIKSNRSG